MQINEQMKDKIINGFDLDFYQKVEAIIDKVVSKWEIDHLDLIESFSVNLVFKAKSETFGPVVIKFGRNDHEFKTEVEALRFFGGQGFCTLYDVDDVNRVLIEEGLEPGDILKDEPSLEERLKIFIGLYRDLHDKAAKDSHQISQASKEQGQEGCFVGYKSYKEWIYRITDVMMSLEDWKEVAAHMVRAKEIFDELSKTYHQVTLLHGDFHYYNILKSSKGYKVIDPKGVLGDPVFDLPRYMLNEFWDCKEEDRHEHVMKMFKYFSSVLDIPESDLGKLLYMEGALSASWDVEDGALIEDKAHMLETLDRLRRVCSAL